MGAGGHFDRGEIRTRSPTRLLVRRCLREILADVMAHWDAVGHHLAVINRPDIEKRSHVRLRALGEMTLTDLAEHRQISGQCIDWSDVGLCALVDVGLTPGAVYSLSFRLLGSCNPISAKATIRWCRVRLDGRSFRVGFEFQD
jgi:hypothetical protein